MESVKLALQGFIARNGRLPCPAVASHSSTDNRYGLEAPTPGTCTGTVDLAGGTFGAYVVDAAQRDFCARCRLPADAFYADSFTSEADKHGP